MSEWKYHTPERDGHAPDDWVEGCEVERQFMAGETWCSLIEPIWRKAANYRYRPLQTVEPDWIEWVPLHHGHGPKDWDGNEAQFLNYEGVWYTTQSPSWDKHTKYRYHRADDASGDVEQWTFDTLKDQCLALPQDQREALIEAMQKPQRDWADDVWEKALEAAENAEPDPTKDTGKRYDAERGIAVIRSMCRPKEVELSRAWLADCADELNTHPDVIRGLIRQALA